MNYALNNEIADKLTKENIQFERAKIEDLEEIIELFSERIEWFKENEIKQWSKFFINHPKEQFEEVIKKGEYFILKRQNEIIGGFQISLDTHFWEDKDTNAYYLYKVCTKVGYYNIGSWIFDIVKYITKINGKVCLRTEHLTKNIKLNEIYEKNDFKIIKQGEDYYEYTLREWRIK